MAYIEETVFVELPAPFLWKKLFYPELGASSKMPKVTFIAPTGERFKTRGELKKYLRAHPGSPDISEFDWTNGEPPRRSPRISQKLKATIMPPPDQELLPKKKRRSSLAYNDGEVAAAESDEEAQDAEFVAKENEEAEKAEAENKKEPMEVDTSEAESGGRAEETPKVEDLKESEMNEPLGVVAEGNGPAEEEIKNKGSVVAAEASGEQNGTSCDADAEADKGNEIKEADEKKTDAAAAVIDEKMDDMEGGDSPDFDVLV
ncbi:hypothetical protein HA466_0111380 [Hirschfeldia incana]|nr:hypothetical protein HA466_0111380 [Hirschfeldia incana]